MIYGDYLDHFHVLAIYAGLIAGTLIFLFITGWKRSVRNTRLQLAADAMEWLQELQAGVRADPWTPPKDLLPAFHHDILSVDENDYTRVRYTLKHNPEWFFVIENDIVTKVQTVSKTKKKNGETEEIPLQVAYFQME